MGSQVTRFKQIFDGCCPLEHISRAAIKSRPPHESLMMTLINVDFFFLQES